MRLTVLGGSGASPNTGAGCSGYLVQDGSTSIALDLGPGTLPELRRHVDHRRLAAVVVSHLHLDHCLDLIALQVALAYNPIPPPRPVPLWLPPGGADWLQRVWSAIGDYDERPGFFLATTEIREYDPAATLVLDDLVARFAPTVHHVPCWAMRIGPHGAPDRDLAYTADTGPSTGLAEFFAGSHLLLAEATLLNHGDRPFTERRSLTARDAGELATAAGVDCLVLTHIWEERGHQAARAQATETFRGRIEAARPGLMIGW